MLEISDLMAAVFGRSWRPLFLLEAAINDLLFRMVKMIFFRMVLTINKNMV